jgi:uncharacterized membrane protein
LRAARFAGHPIHPALVHFPLALWSVTWAWDVLGAWTGSQVWWQTGFWCLVAGTIMALPAAITGLMELAALIVRGGAAAPEDWRVYAVLALSTGGLGLLALGGWYGGRMVYEHGVGRTAPPGS